MIQTTRNIILFFFSFLLTNNFLSFSLTNENCIPFLSPSCRFIAKRNCVIWYEHWIIKQKKRKKCSCIHVYFFPIHTNHHHHHHHPPLHWRRQYLDFFLWLYHVTKVITEEVVRLKSSNFITITIITNISIDYPWNYHWRLLRHFQHLNQQTSKRKKKFFFL